MFSSWLGVIAFFGMFCSASFLVFVWLQGRRSRNGNIEENALHRTWIKLFAGAILVGVVGVEGLVRLHGGLWDTSWLAVLHFYFVVMASALFCLLYFRFTGLRYPELHAPVAYAFIATYCAMLVTGSILFLRYPG